MNHLNTEGFTDKDSRDPVYRGLYEDRDYIEAYSLHTDARIERDGYQAAIGSNGKSGQGWDEHGSLQLSFLQSMGLRPEHQLLDFGCGTGRLACKAVPYLDADNYTGVDISRKGIETCTGRDYPDKRPVFILGDGTLSAVKDRQFHIIWAHSVFTHLPADVVSRFFKDLSGMAFGEFLFTYKQALENQRSGLKQFQYSPAWLVGEAKSHGLKAVDMRIDWPAGQKTMKVTHE